MTKLKTPWLIQRCEFRKGKLLYDYMGSSEFEWGACPKSLKRIFEKGISTATGTITFDYKQVMVYMVAGKEFPFSDYESHLTALAENSIRLQESSWFDRAMKALTAGSGDGSCEYLGNRISVWFDIDNDVLWTLSEANQKELVTVLSRIQELWESKELPKKD